MEQLVTVMYDFIQLDRRQRINLRNRTEVWHALDRPTFRPIMWLRKWVSIGGLCYSFSQESFERGTHTPATCH
jgi:hypothetical protein